MTTATDKIWKAMRDDLKVREAEAEVRRQNDARRLRAAPALLAAAKALLASADAYMHEGYRLSTPIGTPLLEQLRAAISAAEGTEK